MRELRNITTSNGNTGRRLAAALALTCALLVSAQAAHAEYNCMGTGGVAIPGGNQLATYAITQPGCYFLAANRTMLGNVPAVTITASHVHLDLRGRTIRHNVAGQQIITNGGIAITDVHVVNGKLVGAPGGQGINFTGCPFGHFNISDLIIADLNGNVPDMAILIGGGGATSPAHAVIARNMIDVMRFGIILDTVDGGRVEDNVLVGRPTVGNPQFGIQLGDCDANDVRGNTISDIAVPGGAGGTGIRVTIGSSLNNIHHNTISRCFDGIYVDSKCNVVDWNVAMGNLGTGIQFTPTSSENIYSFNRASGTCNNGGPGLLDAGFNTNAGNNF